MLLPILAVALSALTAGPLRAAEAGDFIRMASAPDGTPAALEVAIASYSNDRGVRVDLVSAVHVADRSYFRALDRRLGGYPVVLYELVGEPGSVQTPRGTSPSMVGLLQGGMQNALGLAFQLEEIDYARDNMVHADMSAGEFARDMQDRGESLVGLLFRAWALSVAEQGAAPGQQADLLKVLLADDRQLALKRMMAEQLSGQVDLLERIAGPDGSALIEGRNERALDELRTQLEDGARRVAIFYGAGHMRHFARRLVDDFGFRPRATEWIEAWDLRDR
jgi:hypothetical protein